MTTPPGRSDHESRAHVVATRRGRSGILLCALLAVVLLGSACGSDADVEAGGPDTQAPAAPPVDGDDPVQSPPADPEPPLVGPDPGPNGGPDVVEPAGDTVGARARPWDSFEVTDDGTTLEILFWSGVEPCYVLDRVELDKTDTTVTVTLYEGSDASQPDMACIDIAVTKLVRVALDQPLGQRTVIDGAAVSD